MWQPADLVGGREACQADGQPARSAPLPATWTDKVKLPETTAGATALAAAPQEGAPATPGTGGAPADNDRAAAGPRRSAALYDPTDLAEIVRSDRLTPAPRSRHAALQATRLATQHGYNRVDRRNLYSSTWRRRRRRGKESTVRAATPSPPPHRCEEARSGGIIAVLQDQPTLDRIQGSIRDQQLDDELTLEATLESALRKVREGRLPRILVMDLSESSSPISELSAARSVGGPISRSSRSARSTMSVCSAICSRRATDYLVKPLTARRLRWPRKAGEPRNRAGSGKSSPSSAAAAASATTTRGPAALGCLSTATRRTPRWSTSICISAPCAHLDSTGHRSFVRTLEQLRVDALFVDRAVGQGIRNACFLASEAAVGETLDDRRRAIDVLSMSCGAIHLDRHRSAALGNPTQRLVLGRGERVVIVCERSLAGCATPSACRLAARTRASAEVMMVDAGGQRRAGDGRQGRIRGGRWQSP